jgi:glycosyltransferase involved in cell wall biosynthesis
LLAFALISRILRLQLPKLVLPGFIYTDSSHPVLANFKIAYYRWILCYADVVICHSHLEVETNKTRFAAADTQFVYFPYAIHVSGANDRSSAEGDTGFVVSAGRSGRDYELLIEAVRGMNLDLHIICDQFPEALRAGLPDNVAILDDCYGNCYFDELVKCRFVVIPLSVNDISAGQMVLLQAMALGKPVIITRTATTIDYVQDGDGVLFVEPKDLSAMAHAIQRLNADDSLRHSLGKQASEIFAKRYSIEAYAAHLVDAARMAHDKQHRQTHEPIN